MPLPTLDEFKDHLRLDSDGREDGLLQAYLDGAVDRAAMFLNRPIPWNNSAGEPVDVPASVFCAILLYAADLYENREAGVSGATLIDNPTVERLLHPYRTGLGI